VLNIDTCQDDGAGAITFTLLPPSVEGGPCRQDSDCQVGVCDNQVCWCEPAGATTAPNGGKVDCCSGWYNGSAFSDTGTCAAQAGSTCTTRVPDCFGGTCSNRACTCVGPTGYCNADSDCCAGATKCVAGQCAAQ
jgi:hypothetical protein